MSNRIIGRNPEQAPANQWLGKLAFSDTVFSPAPTLSTDSGARGQLAYDSSYIYVCVAKNNWKRSSLTTF